MSSLLEEIIACAVAVAMAFAFCLAWIGGVQ